MIAISEKLTTFGLITAIGLGMFTLVKLQEPKLNGLDQKALNQTDFHKEAQAEKINLNLWQQMPSFGYGNLVADWALLRFVQYYGDDEARGVTGYELSPEYLEIIVKNDPRFIQAYLIFSPAISINAGMPQKSVELLGKGLQDISPKQQDSYYVWIYRAVDQLLFLGDIKGAQKSYAMAALWAKEAGNLILAKANQESVDYLSKHPQSKRVRVNAWFLVFINSHYPNTRLLAIKKIRELGGKVYLYPEGKVQVVPPKDD